MFWKVLAIAESIMFVIGGILAWLYWGYKIGILSNSFKDILSAVLCAGMFIAFVAGSTGWLIIIEWICERKKEDGSD